MKYELIDLGKPKERVYSTAYIVTPSKNLMIRGGQMAVRYHMGRLAADGIYFFGKMRNNLSKTLNCSINRILLADPDNIRPVPGFAISKTIIMIVSFGIRICRKRENRSHPYYEFIDDNLGITWLKVRRLPEVWPKEIPIDPVTELLISVDFLEERGFTTAAAFIRQNATKDIGRNHNVHYIL